MVAMKPTSFSPDAGKAVNQETCVQVEDESDFTGLEKEVFAKFLVGDVKTAGAAWLDPPPCYTEEDPLKFPETDVGTPSSGSSVTSDDSFWDDDDETDDSVTDAGPSWSELDGCGRVRRVLVQWVGKFVGLIGLLYFFICSLDLLASSFRILGGKTAGGVFTNSELLQNPVAGLMIGILATVLVQSSSTSTSIIVTMVASGIITVQPAIPMIMGANIGTSVTNTFVSMAQSGNQREFRRAFAGATIHDMFNWLTVLILLPLEWATGYLYHFTKFIVSSSKLESYEGGDQQMLKALTKPLTSLIVKVDKKVINKIAEGHMEYLNKSLIKKYCTYDEVDVLVNTTTENNNTVTVNGTTKFVMENVTQETLITEKIPLEKCHSLFSQVELDDTAAGIILLAFSLFVLCTCLVAMVKLLHSLLQGSIAKVIKKTLNSDFPGCFSWLTDYVAILVGAVMTVLVQSSSVFTSALTPLVGIGMIKLERMFPLTLGSNIGTTGTGVLAAMAASGDKLPVALQIALAHLFFNISGIILFFPVKPLRKIPIKLAKFLGTTTATYRWFAILYIIAMFLLLPLSVFAISMAGKIPSICVAAILGTIVSFIILLNILQNKCSKSLPKKLRTWEFLPKPLRSLEPMDSVIMSVLTSVKKCCPCVIKCCTPKKKPSKLIVKPSELRVSPASSAASSCASSRALLNRNDSSFVLSREPSAASSWASSRALLNRNDSSFVLSREPSFVSRV